jgi:hypothetical protein
MFAVVVLMFSSFTQLKKKGPERRERERERKCRDNKQEIDGKVNGIGKERKD